MREIQDNLPSLLDSALRMLLQLLAQWRTALSAGSGDLKVGHVYSDTRTFPNRYETFSKYFFKHFERYILKIHKNLQTYLIYATHISAGESEMRRHV